MTDTLTIPDLNARRKELKMPVAALVSRSRVPRPTVYRILRGGALDVRFGHVLRVAAVLGLPFGTPPLAAEEYRRQEARRKARLVGRLTQGTMALEAQALAPEALARVEEKVVAELLAGPGKKLWSD
jgi:hypothetical protein